MNKKIISLLIIGTLLIILISTGISYAEWTTTSSQEDENIAESNCFNVNLISNTDALLVENDFPKIDEEGMKRDPYSFTIENTCQTDASYQLKLELQSDNTLATNLTKVALNNKISLLSDLDTDGDLFILKEEYIPAGITKEYDFREWFDISGTLENSQNKKISTKIVLEATAAVMPTAAEYVENLYDEGNSSLVNNDPDQNVRYVGNNPNNYVSFNGETWRIIGSFNNIKTTEEGKEEKRLKIIGPEYTNSAWDSNKTNDWTTASSQITLNDTYYNSLTTDAKDFIGESVWNLGGTASHDSSTTQMFYNAERGTTVYNGRPTTWTGNIALMYPSDYGYATSGGAINTREECLNLELYNWDSPEHNDCKENNYLFNDSTEVWTLTQNTSSAPVVFAIYYDGYVNSIASSSGYSQSPVLYLKSNIKIVEGTGTIEDPYILAS